MSQMWGGHLRFFRQLVSFVWVGMLFMEQLSTNNEGAKSVDMPICTLTDGMVHMQLTACKVEQIETFSKKMLAEGHCIVIGLQSTGALSPQQLDTYVTLKLLRCMSILNKTCGALTINAILGVSSIWHPHPNAQGSFTCMQHTILHHEQGSDSSLISQQA